MRRGARPPAIATLAALAAALVLRPAGARAAPTPEQLDVQILEIRSLLRERRYPLALESLRLLARSVQELRLEEVAAAFPEAPPGWNAGTPVSLGAEEEAWARRLEARRDYRRADGGSRISVTLDVHSPWTPTVARAFNPLFVAADPLARLVEVGAEKGLLRFAPDAGDGELRVLLGTDVLVTVTGRGLASADPLLDLARRIDYDLLRTRAAR